MDPLGNISAYLNLVKGLPRERKRWVLFREMGIALLAMLLFSFLGEYLFAALEISEKTVRIGSGVILFLVGIKILFPSDEGREPPLPEGEPFIVPLAIPWIAGPSLLATIMLFSHIEPSVPLMLSAMGAAWLASTLILLFAPQIQKIFKDAGLIATERLIGMVLVLIAIQRFLEGIQQFVKSCQL